MLTTTVDGLWVLQVLANIEVLAPELGLRPHLPSIETTAIALQHPVADELRDVGVITATGEVDSAVLEWLTVLARRDLAALLYAQTPAASQPGDSQPGDGQRGEDGAAPDGIVESERVLLARFAHWWVRLERYGPMVRLGSAGIARNEDAAADIVSSHIVQLCGQLKPAPLRPVTICTSDLLAAVHDPATLRTFLAGQGFDRDQIRTLTIAADVSRSAQASVVAIQSGTQTRLSATHIEPQAVTVIDTPEGRLVSAYVRRHGKSWLIVSPGTSSGLEIAVKELMRRLPAGDDWASYRKVV